MATAGRKKGIPNKTTSELRATVDRLGGCPVRFLANVIAGRHVWVFDEAKGRKVRQMPTLEMRQDAAKALLPRIMPSMQAVEVDSTSLAVSVDLAADLAGLSPVEREQRLLAVRDELSRIGERWPETLTDQERATLARALPEASPAGDDALAQGEAAQPPRPPSYARPAPGYAVRLVEPDSIAALEAAAAGAAAQADGADPDDEGSIEVARLRAETLSAGALHERVPPRHPERPVSWADRMAARRRDAD